MNEVKAFPEISRGLSSAGKVFFLKPKVKRKQGVLPDQQRLTFAGMGFGTEKIK